MVILSLLAVALIFGWIVSLLRLTDVYRALPKPGQLPASQILGPWPSLSVLIPARNEEANIGPLLNTLLDQNYPNLEIIILNDSSTDRTADIVCGFQSKHANIRLATGRPLPAGWAGKIHACAQAAALASGEWLLFLDADIRLAPNCLKRSLAFAQMERADLFTIFPKLRYGCFWEALVQPIMAMAILIWFPIEALSDPTSPVASANGPFMLFRREAYQAIGGHAALEGIVVEDLTLAKRIKQNKRRLAYVLGTDMASLTMYESLSRLWSGWSRNFYVGLERRVALALAACAGIFAFLFLPAVVILGALIYGAISGHWVAAHIALWISVWLLGLAHRYTLQVLFDLDTSHSVLYPLGAVIVIGMIVNSTWKGVRGKNIPWRGRNYSAAS